MKRVCFVVSSLEISGGLYVVLQHAAHMARAGLEVTIATPRRETKSLGDWHPGWHLVRHAGLDDLQGERFDLAIATWWASVYDLPRVPADRYAYFIQGADYLLVPEAVRARAEATYALGLGSVTVSEALGAALRGRFGIAPLVARNGIDKSIFRPDGPALMLRPKGKLRVLVEGPLGASTKGVAYAIRLAQQAGADEIWLLTSSPVRWYPGVTRVISGQNAAGCAAVYRSCDVLLKLSSLESCSLPILEMLHCGGVVATYDIPSPNEYLVDGGNALLLPMGDDEIIVAALWKLRAEPRLRRQLRLGALESAARWPGWEEASGEFLRHCGTIWAQPGPSRSELQAGIDALTPCALPPTSQPLCERLKHGVSIVETIAARSRAYRGIRAVIRAKLLEQNGPAPADIWLPKIGG